MPGMGGTSAEKSRDLKKAYGNLLHYIGRYKAVILTASVLSVIGAILNLIGPSRLSEVTNLITDGMNSTIDLNAIGKIAVLLAALYIAGFVVNLIQGWIMNATLGQLNIQMGNFENMIICDDWAAIHYDISTTVKGKTSPGSVMEFVHFKDYGNPLGVRVKEGWGGPKDSSFESMDMCFPFCGSDSDRDIFQRAAKACHRVPFEVRKHHYKVIIGKMCADKILCQVLAAGDGDAHVEITYAFVEPADAVHFLFCQFEIEDIKVGADVPGVC